MPAMTCSKTYIKQNGEDILRELLRVSAVDPL